MKNYGSKLLDSVLGLVQVDWLIVPLSECRDPSTESQFIRKYFRKPHEPWKPDGAFVQPVNVRRSRRRVLFFQESGLQT
jgi:hypothetical protein